MALLAVQWCSNVKFILLCDHFYVIWVFIELALDTGFHKVPDKYEV